LRTKAILLLDGSATEKLDAMIRYGGGGRKIVGRYASLRDALEQAHAIARAGDTVLLSPGCASFGMFNNEFERGDQFREIVNTLESANHANPH